MKHTELPIIYISSYGQNDEGCYDLISNPDSNTFNYIGKINKKANAAFIVKACNEYHPLIRVVKALVEKLDADVWFLETAKNEGICVESIKQIIEQAEE